jgi:hypothetical protein
MTVKNDKCVWCMDPTQISTIVVDGCGKCKPGTFEYHGKCYSKPQASVVNNFQLNNPKSNGVYWSIDLNFSTDARTLVSFYLAAHASRACITCEMRGFVPIYSQWTLDNNNRVVPSDIHSISSQYLQFDRGRFSLNMTERVIRSWASCPDSKACNGVMVALFVTTFPNSTDYRTQQLEQPLKFEMDVQSLVLSGGGAQPLMLARMELHYFVHMDAWMVCLIGTGWTSVHVQWDQGEPLAASTQFDNFIPVRPPPTGWTTLRVRNELNSSTLLLQQPVSVVTHGALDAIQYSGIMVRIQYGLGFANSPSPGDSEQLIFVTARSPQPIRLKSLSTTIQNGAPVLYTTSKGFITDPTRVVDLSLGCLKPTATLINWLSNAIAILSDSPPRQLTAFIAQSCALIRSGAISKGYWLAPAFSARRADVSEIQVVAEFV